MDLYGRAMNWIYDEVLNLIVIWAKERTIATTAKSRKSSQLNQVVYKHIMAQMVAQGVPVSLASDLHWNQMYEVAVYSGRDVSRVLGTTKTMVPYCEKLSKILKADQWFPPHWALRTG